jgi:hypothetical protein
MNPLLTGLPVGIYRCHLKTVSSSLTPQPYPQNEEINTVEVLTIHSPHPHNRVPPLPTLNLRFLCHLPISTTASIRPPPPYLQCGNAGQHVSSPTRESPIHRSLPSLQHETSPTHRSPPPPTRADRSSHRPPSCSPHRTEPPPRALDSAIRPPDLLSEAASITSTARAGYRARLDSLRLGSFQLAILAS